MMYDYPVGNIVYYENIVLEVIAQESNAPLCCGCVFSDHQREKRHLPKISCVNHGLICTAFRRKDRHHVIFKEVK